MYKCSVTIFNNSTGDTRSKDTSEDRLMNALSTCFFSTRSVANGLKSPLSGDNATIYVPEESHNTITSFICMYRDPPVLMDFYRQFMSIFYGRIPPLRFRTYIKDLELQTDLRMKPIVRPDFFAPMLQCAGEYLYHILQLFLIDFVSYLFPWEGYSDTYIVLYVFVPN